LGEYQVTPVLRLMMMRFASRAAPLLRGITSYS
jgi:hypothetical protein